MGKPLDSKDSQALEAITKVKDEADLKTMKTVPEMAHEWEAKQKNDNGGDESNFPPSLMMVQQWNSAQAKINLMEYKNHVLDYVLEWEHVVTTRIDAELKEVKKLASDRQHYEKKVEDLRKKTNDIETKGKTVNDATKEKLDRNEEKLKESFELHEKAAGRLCVLIEEVTQRGWKDLYPLVKNVMKWESNRVGRDDEIYSKLLPNLEAMKATARLEKKKK